MVRPSRWRWLAVMGTSHRQSWERAEFTWVGSDRITPLSMSFLFPWIWIKVSKVLAYLSARLSDRRLGCFPSNRWSPQSLSGSDHSEITATGTSVSEAAEGRWCRLLLVLVVAFLGLQNEIVCVRSSFCQISVCVVTQRCGYNVLNSVPWRPKRLCSWRQSRFRTWRENCRVNPVWVLRVLITHREWRHLCSDRGLQACVLFYVAEPKETPAPSTPAPTPSTLTKKITAEAKAMSGTKKTKK